MALDPNSTDIKPWNPDDGVNNYPAAGAVPELATATAATAATADAATADAATRTLQDGELTSNRVAGLINQDSPLMQQAAGRAKQEANSRGLINSSMAVQAGQAAVMDRAVPIAQDDARATSAVLNSNQANEQQTRTFNAGQTQDANKFNANMESQTSQFNSSEQNKASIVNASESNKIIQQLMDNQNKLYLADIEASYKNTMQSSASAMTLYQQSVKNISEILMNPDLGEAAKTAAVDNQNSLLETGMKILSKIGGLQLDELLSFPTA